MTYERLAGRLYNVPLLITPEKAAIIESVFRAHVEHNAPPPIAAEPRQRIELASESSMRRTDGGYYMNTAGVAVVQVHGSLVQRGDGMDALSGLTGYNRIGAQLAAAIRDPNVRGVVLEIDSPGGEVPGLMELAGQVANSTKPIWSHANEVALSAAYWLAAAASKVYAPTTGMLGSIGVLMMHVDRSRQIEKAGLVYTPIFAGARKLEGASIAPLSEEARTHAQARVDQVYSMFVEHVASYRSVSEKTVRDTEAGTFTIQDAIGMKFADGIATLGDVVQMMTDDLNNGRIGADSFFGRAAANHAQSNERDLTMTDTKAAPAVAVLTQEHVDAAKAAGIAEGRAVAMKEAQTVAAKSAAERIKAITSSDAGKARPALAAHLAFEHDEISAESAIALMEKAATETKAATNPLDAALAGTNPKVGADSGDKAGASSEPRETAQSIFERRRMQMQAVK